MRLLIIQTAFLGDVVLATSIVERLKNTYPDIIIDMMVKKGYEQVPEDHPYIHQVLSFDKSKKRLPLLYRLLGQIRKNAYDAVINLQRFSSTAFLTAFSGASHRVGFNSNFFASLYTKKVTHSLSKGLHEVQRNMQLLEGLTSTDFERPHLYPKTLHSKSYLSDQFICIAPSSVWQTKRYPVEKWVSLILKIDKEIPIFLIGGPEDKDMCNTIVQACPSKQIKNKAGTLSIMESVSLIEKAAILITNDSAPLHFASAVNTPTIAIFCSTSPAFGFGPLADQSISIETRDQLDCRPCGIHGKKTCPKGHFNCSNIDEAEILAHIDSILQVDN